MIDNAMMVRVWKIVDANHSSLRPAQVAAGLEAADDDDGGGADVEAGAAVAVAGRRSDNRIIHHI